ncbi:uncharacterized protein [Miscanthus floridulus]|uniref:uncharacterized protein isoform X2 n=1 Tax=Miscanthus floridulus TaxID=154761 RepID=UPI003459E709
MDTARAHGTAEQPEGGGGDSATSRTQRAFPVGSNDFVNNCYLEGLLGVRRGRGLLLRWMRRHEVSLFLGRTKPIIYAWKPGREHTMKDLLPALKGRRELRTQNCRLYPQSHEGNEDQRVEQKGLALRCVMESMCIAMRSIGLSSQMQR